MNVALSPAPAPARTEPAPAAPPRDAVLDLLRAGALAVVVVWHWVFTTLSWDADGPHVDNPVGVTPHLWAATWVAQVMPLFFFVGGALHAATYRAPGRSWVARRMRRLFTPVLPLLALAGAALGVCALNGWWAAANTVVLIISPMWFLAVYAMLVVLAPLALAAHRRAPNVALGSLVSITAACDVIRFTRHPSSSGAAVLVVVSFVATWAAVHQIGFRYRALRALGTRAQSLVAAGGLAALVILSTAGPYTRAMVGAVAIAESNMAPPTLMVVALGAFQAGLVARFAPALGRFAARHRDALDDAAAWSMTVFAWHLVAWGAFAAVALAVAGSRVNADLGTAWWQARPVWLIGPALIAAPLLALVGRFDPALRTRRTPRGAAGASIAGTC